MNFSESFLNADTVSFYKNENFIEAKGNVKILADKFLFKTEKVIIDLNKNIIISDSPIEIISDKEIITAEKVVFNRNDKTGIFINSSILLNEHDLVIAEKVHKISENEIYLNNAKFTPCKSCHFGNPIWEINAQKTEINLKTNSITYKNASAKLFGVRIFTTPYFSHPLKNADAKSGILTPKIINDQLQIPLYYRAADNLDFTYSPRFNTKSVIHELEMRHINSIGEYSVFSSINNSNIKLQSNNEEIKNDRLDRYYFNAKGKLNLFDQNLGFNIGKVSDKSYLKNYYLDNRDYIESEIYMNNFHENGYNTVNFKHFQGLRNLDSKKTDPTILPNFIVSREYSTENGWDFELSNDLTNYREDNVKNIFRNRVSVGITKNNYGKYGEIISYGISNKFDYYNILRSNSSQKKIHTRNIPEFHTSLRIPRSLYFGSNTIIFEPRISATIGTNSPRSLSNLELIDSPNIDVNENNIFNSSRFSGIDFHEYGRRINYGLNVNLLNNNFSLSSFLGQAISTNLNDEDSRSNYVGKLSLKYKTNFELYYRFKKQKNKFSPVRDEIGIWTGNENFRVHNNLTILRDINNFNNFYYKVTQSPNNIIRQNYTHTSINLSKDLELFGDLKIDLGEKLKSKVLSYSTGLNLTYDCISTYFVFTNNFTADTAKNVKKTRSYTFKLGLKSINF